MVEFFVFSVKTFPIFHIPLYINLIKNYNVKKQLHRLQCNYREYMRQEIIKLKFYYTLQ